MVYTLGESLLDIIINTPDDVVVRPGGAMLNTAVSLARSNIEVSLISELGDDNTANLIVNFLIDNNVILENIKQYQNNNTSLALAFLDKNKKPSYTFIKNYPEVRNLESNFGFNSNDILLFGSLYSLDKQIRKSIVSIVEDAKINNATIIYDPNIRNKEHLKDHNLLDAVYRNMQYSNIIKGSDEDMANIFGKEDLQYQLKSIRKINNTALVIITLGSEGLFADYNGKQIRLPAIKTQVRSTIGAGDAFNAGIIYALSGTHRSEINIDVDQLLASGLEFSAKVCASMDNYI